MERARFEGLHSACCHAFLRRYVTLGARTVPEMLIVRFESKAVQALSACTIGVTGLFC